MIFLKKNQGDYLMNCNVCGAEIGANDGFCCNCGTPVYTVPVPKGGNNSGSNNKALIIIIITAAVVLIGIIITLAIVLTGKNNGNNSSDTSFDAVGTTAEVVATEAASTEAVSETAATEIATTAEPSAPAQTFTEPHTEVKTTAAPKPVFYITSAKNQMSPYDMDIAAERAEAIVKTKITNDWYYPDTLQRIEYCGYYFFSKENPSGGEAHNYLYFIYSCSVRPRDGYDFSFYFPVCFKNIVMNEYGTGDIDYSKYETPYENNATFKAYGLTYHGLENFKYFVSGYMDTKQGYNMEYDAWAS